MKRFIVLLLVFVLCVPYAVANNADPIVGGWYVMFDYRDLPASAETAGKNYMFYLLFFESDGTINGVSGENLQNTGIYANCSSLGTWSNNNGVYTVNVVGLGTSNPTIENDRLIFRMIDTIHYSMRRLECGSWYTDILYR